MAEEKAHNSPFISIDDFEKIFREYFSPLVWFAMRYVKDADAAKEVVHHVFFRIWEKRHEIHHDTPLRSYLFTAVRNRCLNYIRDNSKFRRGEITDLQTGEDFSASAQDNMEAAELEAAMNSAIAGLPEKCALVFKMNRLEGLKYKEIAIKLNISVKTVEAQMSKALKHLRKILVDYLEILVLWLVIHFF